MVLPKLTEFNFPSFLERKERRKGVCAREKLWLRYRMLIMADRAAEQVRELRGGRERHENKIERERE